MAEVHVTFKKKILIQLSTVTFRNQPNETLGTRTASVACPKTHPSFTAKSLGGQVDNSHHQTDTCREALDRCQKISDSRTLKRRGVIEIGANCQWGRGWLGLRSPAVHNARLFALLCCHTAVPQPAVAHRPAPRSSGGALQAGHHFAVFPAFHFIEVPSWKFYIFPHFWSRLQLWLPEEMQWCWEWLNMGWRKTSSAFN